MLEPLASILERPGRILLSTHENPDADGLGSLLALGRHFMGRGQSARAVVAPMMPESYLFMDPDGWIESFDAEAHRDLAAWPELWLLVDASEPRRMGPLQATFEASRACKVCLDHHLLTGPHQAFDHVFAFPDASASAELVFHLLQEEIGLPLPPPIAEALYTGIVDDTGNFRYSNATAAIHRTAAHLIEQGVRPDRTYRELYQQGHPRKMRLLGRAIDGMRLLAEGRHGSLTVTARDMRELGAVHEDLDGLVNKPMELKGVEVASLYTELDDGRIKASLRSRERVDVNAVCVRFGGGGHRLASGAKLDPPLEAARARMDAEIAGQIRHDLDSSAS